MYVTLHRCEQRATAVYNNGRNIRRSNTTTLNVMKASRNRFHNEINTMIVIVVVDNSAFLPLCT